MAKNLDLSLPALEWRKTGDDRADLDEIYKQVHEYVLVIISWYLIEKRRKARMSKALRIFAIIAAAAGLLTPLINLALPRLYSTDWGFVLLAVAGMSLGSDKLFGFSSAWRRYMVAATELQSLAAELSMTRIAASLSDGSVKVSDSIGMLNDFVLNIHVVIRKETELWVTEFANLTEKFGTQLEAAAGKIL